MYEVILRKAYQKYKANVKIKVGLQWRYPDLRGSEDKALL